MHLNKRMMKYNEKVYKYMKPEEKKPSPLQSIWPDQINNLQNKKKTIRSLDYSEVILNNHFVNKKSQQKENVIDIHKEGVLIKPKEQNSSEIWKQDKEKNQINIVNQKLHYSKEIQENFKMTNENFQKFSKKKRVWKNSSIKLSSYLKDFH